MDLTVPKRLTAPTRQAEVRRTRSPPTFHAGARSHAHGRPYPEDRFSTRKLAHRNTR